jgi:hypothetical protein
LGPGARARVPSPPVVKADGVIRTEPHIYEAVMGNSYMVVSHWHSGWRVGEADPGIGHGAWIGRSTDDRDAIRDEEGGRTAAAGATTNGGPHLVAAGCITGHTHQHSTRGTPSWEGRRSERRAGATVLIDSDLIAGSPCDRRPARDKAPSVYACSGIGCERPTAATPSGYIAQDAHPPCAGDVVLILLAVSIVDKEGAGGGGDGVALGCGEAGDEDAPLIILHV